MKFLIDDIYISENDPQTTIRKKVADKLGANYRNLRVEVKAKRWVRTDKGGMIRLRVVAETNEFLRSTSVLPMVSESISKSKELSWKERPVVAGFGIPGIVAAFYLAKLGLRPIVLERGNSLSVKASSPKDKETLNPDGEGGFLAYTGALFCLDNLDPELFALFEDVGLSFQGTDACRFLSPSQLRDIIAKLHSEILNRGGEIIFNATYLGVRKRFGKFKGVLYEHRGQTKLIKSTKLLLTYGANDDVFYVGTSAPASPSNYNNAIYGRKTIDLRTPPYYAEHELKLGQSGKGLFITGLQNARVTDIGSRSELCLQSYNYDGKGRHVHSFIGIEIPKEEAEKICKGAYDANKPKHIPCSGINDFLSKKTPLRLGAIKPERVSDIRLENFAKLMGAAVAKRLATALTHFAKSYPYLLAKDSIFEGLMVLPGCKDGEPKIIDGVYVSRIPATKTMDFAAKATAGFRAAKLMTE